MSEPSIKYFTRKFAEASNVAQVDLVNELAVLEFSRSMLGKLVKARVRGRHGWHDPSVVSNSKLSVMLSDQFKTDDIDFVDIANLAMMLHFRLNQ